MRAIWTPDWLLRRSEVCATVWVARLIGMKVGWASPVPTLIPLALLAVGVWGVVRLLRRETREQEDRARHELWLLRAVLAGWAWLLLGLINQTLFVDRHMSLFVGRYLPVVLPSLGIVMGMGVSELLPDRVRPPAAIIVLVATVGYGVRVLLAVAAAHGG